MNRTLTIMASLAVAFIASTASADTHLWVTTEGAGLELTSEGHRSPPPPPRHHHSHNHHGYCKACKKHYKKMMKQAKKHHKEARKAAKKHKKNHHR
ncbi:MAG: hypothetical protein K2M69_01005 [Muribaculaceae bacterium]|nr:hypothetical protein [Muribaculaceae bacterium]